jgi:hypothetical protein
MCAELDWYILSIFCIYSGLLIVEKLSFTGSLHATWMPRYSGIRF